MNGINSNKLLQDLESITRENLLFVQNQVEPLNEQQLVWKSSQESWSILEVLAHLNVYSTYYQRVFEEKIKYTRHKQPLEVFHSSPLGRSTWKSVKLGNLRNIKRRLRSARTYNPNFNKNLMLGTEIRDFINFQQELVLLLQSAAKVNLRKVKIPTSLSKFIKLRLGDAFLFHVYHNERHIEQINRILQHPKFPK